MDRRLKVLELQEINLYEYDYDFVLKISLKN